MWNDDDADDDLMIYWPIYDGSYIEKVANFLHRNFIGFVYK